MVEIRCGVLFTCLVGRGGKRWQGWTSGSRKIINRILFESGLRKLERLKQFVGVRTPCE